MTKITKRQALEELVRRKAIRDFSTFTKLVWSEIESVPYLELVWQKKFFATINEAVRRYEAGEHVYLCVSVPPRHGKTLVLSQCLPAYLLGKNPDSNIIMTGYGSSLTETQSKNVKRIMSTKIYQWIYPGVLPRHGDNSVSSWSLNDSQGRITAVPISGGLTGKGANVILADDLVRNLEVARSKIECQKLFAGFRADLLSRINPGRGSLVIVIGTPWSTIDPIAMIHQTMREDPTFPRFEVIKYPARNPDGTYLEEKAFGRAYYDLQYSSLGKMANSLMDLSPVMEGGNRFDVTKLDYVDAMPEGLKWFRGWDLASSDTERNGSDPDYTASCKLAIKQETTPIGRVIHIYVADFVAIREEAPKRNALIKEIAKAESGTTQVIEAFGSGGKDAYAMLSQELRGIAIVKPSKMTGDKSAKAAPLEIPWDAGNVHVLKTAMNKNRGLVEEQFSNFPFARHDDLVDAMAVAYHAAQHTSIGFIL